MMAMFLAKKPGFRPVIEFPHQFPDPYPVPDLHEDQRNIEQDDQEDDHPACIPLLHKKPADGRAHHDQETMHHRVEQQPLPGEPQRADLKRLPHEIGGHLLPRVHRQHPPPDCGHDESVEVAEDGALEEIHWAGE